MEIICAPKFAVDIPHLLSIYPPPGAPTLKVNNFVKNEDIEKILIAFNSQDSVVSSTSSLKKLAFVGGFLWEKMYGFPYYNLIWLIIIVKQINHQKPGHSDFSKSQLFSKFY